MKLIPNKLAQLRRKHISVALTTAVAGAIGLAVLILAVEMLLDWWLELPLVARIAILAVNLTVIVFILLRYAATPILFGPDDEELALWVERAEPEFRSRLIASVQFTQPEAIPAGASVGMIKAMVRETESLAESKDFRRIVKTDGMLRTTALALLVVVLGLAGLALGGNNAGDLLKRAFLVPGVEVPRKTRVEVLGGDKTIARGDAVDLVAVAHGIVPRSGRVELQYASQDNPLKQSFVMQADLDPADHFTTHVQNVQNSFTYQVFLNDGHSQVFTIRAEERPAVASLECQQIYPPYTGQQNVRRSAGDLTLLAGSRLMIHVTANKKVRVGTTREGPNNHIHLAGSNVDYALVADIADPTHLTARDGKQNSIPLPAGTTGFSVHLVDENGLTSKDPAVYRIDLIPDKVPTLRVTYPERPEDLITQNASMVIGFDAADDYGLAKVSLKYRLKNTTPEGPAPLVDLKFDEGGDGTVIKDTSGNGHDGYLEEKASFTGGKFGGALAFDGKKARAVVPDSPDLRFNSGQSFTLAAWVNVVKPPAPGRWVAIAEKSRGEGNWYGLWISDKNTWVAGSNNNLVSDVKTTPGWHHLALVQDAATGKRRLYLDGKQIAEGDSTNGDGPGDLWIGGAKGGNDFFNGDVDGVQVYNVALSVVELNRLVTPPPADPNAGIKSIALDLKGQPRSLHGRYDWSMKDLKPDVGDVIEWWLEAQDNNDVTGPGRFDSDHFQARVVSDEEKRRELFSRLGNNWEQLNSISESQEQLNLRLGQVLTGHAEPK
jgi:hypothetical protein